MRQPRYARRRGMIAVVVVTLLILVALIGSTLIRMSLLQRLEVETEERRLQVDWLLESARMQAASRLRAEPGYRGETWKVPSEQLGGRGSARILIRVLPENRPAETLEIQASYPVEHRNPAQRTIRLSLPRPIVKPEP